MIGILSSDVHELTTDEVMSWLYAWDCPFIRINGEFITQQPYDIRIGNSSELAPFHFTNTQDAYVIWYRRWHKRLDVEAVELPSMNLEGFVNLKKYLANEISIISSFFFNQLKSAVWVDHPKDVHLNKLQVLRLAAAAGLRIPETIVTNSRKELARFIEKYNRVITKPISEVSVFYAQNKSFAMDTKEVEATFFSEYDTDFFFPSLVQELIEKRYDIRIFYLDGSFYSMAIMSQRRVTASIDFRNYDFANPDRNVPYKLPVEVEEKLQKLIETINLSNCSIDMIRSVTGEHVFLEVNPVGQFGMVSKPCNYHLEMRLAAHLKSRHDACHRE